MGHIDFSRQPSAKAFGIHAGFYAIPYNMVTQDL